MKKGTASVPLFAIWTSIVLVMALGAVPLLPQSSLHCVVRGRIEVLAPKSGMHDVGTDSSGVAVWLIPTKEIAKPEPVQAQRRTLEQRDKRFIPHLMVVQVGTEVEFPNHDPFFHNVFSVYDGKPFDLGLYANGESKPVRFNRPGVSHIYCNIHPQMSAVIVTVDTPYFAISTPDGKYSIENVPAGTYQMHIWHERSDDQQLADQSRIVSVAAPVAELGVTRLDETGYIPGMHKDKNGQDYDTDRHLPAYR